MKDNTFWLGFWLVFGLSLNGVAAIIGYYDHQGDLVQQQTKVRELDSPIVETCVQHRVSQKVVVQ